MICRATIIVMLLSTASIRAQEASVDPLREARLQYVKDAFAEWKLFLDSPASSAPDRELKHHPEPLLRYTNPIGGLVQDGAVFVWRDGAVPVAACSLTLRGPQDPPLVFVEMTSMIDVPMLCQRNGVKRWTPRQGGSVRQLLQAADAPSAKPVTRLVQMRNLSRRFRVEEWNSQQQFAELRLMTQPIDRYQDPSAGIVDGALFAFVEANDPQLLVTIEAWRQEDEEPVWRYTLSRMSSRQQRVLLDDREVFSVGNFWQGSKSPDEPYREMSDSRMLLKPAGTNSTNAASGL